MKRSEIELIVTMTVEKVLAIKDLEVKQNDEWLTTSEAARMLGLSPFRLRMIKDRFDHKKCGDTQSGRLLFKKSSLLENYTR